MEYSFKEWKSKVEQIVYKSIGLYLDDLPDEDFMMNYEDSVTPDDMAAIVLLDSFIHNTVQTFCN